MDSTRKRRQLERRRQYFRMYAENFSHFYPDREDLKGKFVCPVCGDVFDESAVEPENLKVDLAHVFPRACGGKVVTLTCCECNNRMGIHFDPHLARIDKIYGAMSGTGENSIQARMKINGENLGVEVIRRKDHYNLRVIEKQSNKASIDKVQQWAKSGPSDFEFKLSYPAPNHARASVSILASAYLALFWHFGYEYPLTCETGWVREILMNPEPPKDIPFRSIALARGSLQLPPEKYHYTIGVAQTTDGTYTWGVGLPCPAVETPVLLVLMPGPGDRGYDDYVKGQQLANGPQSVFYQVHMEPNYPRLRNRLSKGHARTIWWKFTGQKFSESARKSQS